VRLPQEGSGRLPMPEARAQPSSLEGIKHAGHPMPAPPYRARAPAGPASDEEG